VFSFKSIAEANSPQELEIAKARHREEIEKKQRSLTRHRNNANQISKIPTEGLSKKKKIEVKTYSDMFSNMIASTEHKLKRHQQALEAIRRIQSPTNQEIKQKKIADRKRLDTLGRSTGILASFRRVFGG
jgi:hypothetical protein